MTRIRRSALIALAVAAIIGIGALAPAQAAFSDGATVSTGIATATVAPPTNVVGKLTCGRSSATMSATWTASTSAKISGYLVTTYFSDGFVQSTQLSATATSWSSSIDPYFVTAYSVAYSVTAQTSYGWVKESARTGTFQC